MSDPYYSLPYVSQSSLKSFMASPVAYHYNYILGFGRGVKTAATNLGSLVHSMLLEPTEVDRRYHALDEERRPELEKGMTSLKNKEWKQTMQAYAVAAGQEVVSPSLLAIGDEMVKVVCSHVTANSLLWPEDCLRREVELAITWQHDCAELQLKSKLDLLTVDINFEKGTGEFTIVDYKTTSASSLQEFGWSVKKYGYDVQAAFYMDAAYAWLEDTYPGIEFTGKIVFILQRTVAPYQVLGVVQLSYATEQAARVRYTKALQQLETCLQTDVWQEDTGIQLLDLSSPIVESASELDLPFDNNLPLDIDGQAI